MSSTDTKAIYILDRYTSKNFKLEVGSQEEFVLNEKLVFYADKEKDAIPSIGMYIGEKFSSIQREWIYDRRLTSKEGEEFDSTQKKAREHFPLFKKLFKKNFPDATPVTARYHIFSHQCYFYFYAEHRLDFKNFIMEFRQQFPGRFFFYQVDARNMIKMSPATDYMLWIDGRPLPCKSNLPLPNVEVDDILIQHLEGRDIERLKWLSGKLKCSLSYELDTYIEESKYFPQRGTRVSTDLGDREGVVTDFNIMTRMITLKTDEDERIMIHLDEFTSTTSLENK